MYAKHHFLYNEIFLQTSTSKNYLNTTQVPYHDHSIWMMVLDHRLQFLAEPLSFHVEPATLEVFPLHMHDSVFLAGLISCYASGGCKSYMCRFSNDFTLREKYELKGV